MSPEENHGAGAPSTTPNNDWTIMLYITADGTLTNFAVESLKQLNKSVSTGAGVSGKPRVKVAAYFSFPGGATNPAAAAAGAPANQITSEYTFPAPESKSSQRNSKSFASGLVRTLPDPTPISKPTGRVAQRMAQAQTPAEAKMSVQEALEAFVNGVYKNEGLKSDHYALILWGHGPELLLRPPAPNSTGNSDNLYLTPGELREVLKECTPPTKDSKLDIIGFDACFMSMFEMADELKGLADYMVASQDEVPDLSFPYDSLVELFRRCGGDARLLLREGVEAYVATYQNCVCNNTTEMNPVTLCALDLNNCGTSEEPGVLAKALRSLACALLKAKDDGGLADVLIEARGKSKDYAGGLYVDLYDFCENLNGRLGRLNEENKKRILESSGNVQKALEKGKPDSLILANSQDDRGRGISIYLPYLTDTQYAQAQKPLVKGNAGTHSGKGFTDVLNGAGSEYLMCVRRDLILDTESYYPDLKLARETHWYDFITDVWTRALMKKVPADLDYHYSAQQSWMNVTGGPVTIANPCPETSA